MEFDAIEVALNPVQADALEQILLLTAPHRRLAVALAFAGLSYPQLGVQSGIGDAQTYRWLVRRENRLPFGAALRYSRVLGDVSPGLLFEAWL